MKKYIHLFCYLIVSFTVKDIAAQPAYIFNDKGSEKLEKGDYLASIKEFDTAIQKDKNFYTAFANKARAEAELGKKEEALKNFEQAIKLKPDYVDAYYYRALLYLKANDKQALNDLNKTIQLDPKKTEAYHKRALYYYQNKQDNEALKDFNKVIELKGADAEIVYYRGEILFRKEKLDEALADFNEVIKKNNLHHAAIEKRANIFFKQTKYEAALKDFNSCINNGIRTESVFAGRAECYLKLRMFNDALKDYNTLIDIFKTKDIKAYEMRANAYYEKKDWANAVKDCNKILILQRDYVPAYLLRARVFVQQGKSKYMPALNDFKKVNELDPGNIEAWNGKGNLLFETAKYKDALEAFDKSISLKPEAASYYIRSKCYYKLNNLKACCADLQKAVAMGYKDAQKDIDTVCR